ncbi:MAG: hypothetical protein Q7R35_09135 [Elusimicrobiota bacterium]|nr:hypothetical protein [Elusimicrobiota bacterium]
MRHLLFIGGVAALCVVAGLGFWAANKSKAALEPGVLTAQVNTLAAGWEAKNVPAAGRVVNIIISDADTAALADKLSESDSSGAAGLPTVLDGETLAYADKPPVWKRILVWFKRTFLRKTMSAGEDSLLVKSLGNLPNTLAWTHKGFETASEEEMARELMKAIIKANDAGAEVNIITRGPAAAPALKAIKRLEGAALKGKSITVNKLLALDMNKTTLQKIDPVYFDKFKRPGNLNEWVNVWSPPSPPSRTTIELFSQNRNGVRFYADEIFPEMGLPIINPPEPRATVADPVVLKFTQALINHPAGIEKALDYLAQAAKAKAEQKKIAVTARDLLGRAYKREITASTAPKPALQPLDSLSALNAGWLKEEVKKDEKPAANETRMENQTGSADNQAGNASNCNKGYCNWYDAKASCGGRLPTVAQLQSWYQAECTGGRQGNTCNKEYWSSEKSGSGSARLVFFSSGKVSSRGRGSNYGAVRCAR